MKLAEILELTDDEILKTVAELTKWKDLVYSPLRASGFDATYWRGTCPEGYTGEPVPDFPNDLNAMAEVQNTLRSGKEMNRMISERAVYGEVLLGIALDAKIQIWETTAKQKARAFIVAKTHKY